MTDEKKIEIRRAANIGMSQTTQASGVLLWRAEIADKLRRDLKNEDLMHEYEYLTNSLKSILAL